jgi:hypothetical protein
MLAAFAANANGSQQQIVLSFAALGYAQPL